MSKWISVEEELPELHQRVLTWTTDADDEFFVWMAHWNGEGKNEGFIATNGYRDKDVTHWMPLPEPPEDSMTVDELIKRTDKAVSEASYSNLVSAFKSIEEVTADREALVKAFRELNDKPEPTKFEALWLMIVYRYLQSEVNHE